MSEISEAILQKQKEINRLQKQIDSLRDAQEILEGHNEAREKPTSQPKMAYAILEELGKPMHVAQIAEQMKKKFHVTVKVSNFSVMLFRYAKRGKSFYKVKGSPSTYGLIKWSSVIENAERIRAAS